MKIKVFRASLAITLLTTLTLSGVVEASAQSLACSKLGQVKKIKGVSYQCSLVNLKKVFTPLKSKTTVKGNPTSPTNPLTGVSTEILPSSTLQGINPQSYSSPSTTNIASNATPSTPYLSDQKGPSGEPIYLSPLTNAKAPNNGIYLSPEKEKYYFGSELADQARADFYKQYNNTDFNNMETNIKFVVDPKLSKEKESQIKWDVTQTVKYFNSLRPASLPLTVYISYSPNFAQMAMQLKDQLTTQSLDGGWIESKIDRAKLEGANLFSGAAPGYAKTGEPVVVYLAGEQTYGNMSYMEVLSHEYTHVVQRYILNNDMGAMTCWIREGMAEYNGNNFASRVNNQIYISDWSQNYFNAIHDPLASDNVLKNQKETWEKFFLDQETKPVHLCDRFLDNFLGNITFQYLSGKFGHEAITRWLQDMATNRVKECTGNSTGAPCSVWKSSYQRVFNEEINYPEIASFLSNQISYYSKLPYNNDYVTLNQAEPAFKLKK